jgi:hypothetical protein
MDYKFPNQIIIDKSVQTWLAQRMSQVSQSDFLIEKIQPNWLQSNLQNRTRVRSRFIESQPMPKFCHKSIINNGLANFIGEMN